MNRLVQLIITVVVANSYLWPTSCRAEDWTQFRGPNGNGVASVSGTPMSWNSETNLQWKSGVPGEGWSAPIVSSGKIILTTAVPTVAADDESIHRFEIHCLDLVTGKPMWQRVASEGKPRVPKHKDNTFASETPVTDGQRIIAYFGMNGLFCYDFDGQLLWQKDLGVFEMQADWGTSSSPAMANGLVFIQVDNEQDSFLVALDAKSGDERWRVTREEKSTWCSPIIWKNKERTELVTGGKTIRSHDPQTGTLLWQLVVGERASSASPAGNEEMLIVGARGLFAVRANATGDITPESGAKTSAGVIWSSDRGGPSMASPIIYKDFIYICDRRGGIVTCYHAADGKEAYKERLPGEREFWSSPWVVDDKIFCLDDSGATHVIAPGAEFKLLGTNQLEGRFWATSAIVDGAVLLRGSDTLYCVKDAAANSRVRAVRAETTELPARR